MNDSTLVLMLSVGGAKIAVSDFVRYTDVGIQVNVAVQCATNCIVATRC